jgi:DNA-binding NarL/FixJ family response regulator
MAGGPLAGLAELRRRQGRPDDAARLCERAPDSSGGRLCLARMALDRGAAREAAELAERLLRQVPEHRRLSRAPALDLLVRARAAAGDLDGAAEALAALREVERLVGTAPLRACADAAEGVLAGARGEHDRARVLLEDAVDAFTRSGAPFEAAQARLALAAALTALGRTEAGEREVAVARERLRELAGGPAAPPLPELTPREREVLALLAEGLTNRGIAEQLVVSEHTVHRHVNSILRKLDLPSRTAAAALAVRAGL